MRRLLLLASALLANWLLAPALLFAQESTTWAAYPLKDGWSGPGYYLHWGKIVACWIVFLFWVRGTDWVNRDGQGLRLKYLRWNGIVFGTFVAAFVLLWLIPFFWLGFPLLMIAYAGPMISYVLHRNSLVDPHDKVMTPDHLRHWFAGKVSTFGMKVATEKQDPHTSGPPVVLTARGGDTERDDNTHLLAARQSEGFHGARQVIADGLIRRSDAIMLDYSQEAVAVRYMVDGVWHQGESLEREKADPVLESFKLLIGGNPQDRQSRQQGQFLAEFETRNINTSLATQGTKTGERALLQFEGKQMHFDTLDEIGMRPKMQEQLLELFGTEKGMLLFSAIPASGLRTTMTVALNKTDRFTREYGAVEDEKIRYEEIENIPVTVYKSSEGQTPADVLRKVFLIEPNVVVCRDLVNAATIKMLCDEILEEDRLIVSTIRAKDGANALLRVLAMKAPHESFAKVLTAVLSQRLIRKLCEHCKEAYIPAPQLLTQLGIPEGRVQAFYRPPQNPETVCPECQGIGYIGRTAIFELFLVDQGVRQTLIKTPKLDALRAAAKKAGTKSLQEEGIVLVAKSITSLPELMRVLKQ